MSERAAIFSIQEQPKRHDLFVPAAVFGAGIGVYGKLHAFAVQIVGERLHASRPQRKVLLQLVRHCMWVFFDSVASSSSLVQSF